MEEIEQHLARFLGEPQTVLHEIASDLVHVDVHVIPPRPERERWTLFTTGMSDRPMAAPSGHDELALAELMISLPADWRVDAFDVTPPELIEAERIGPDERRAIDHGKPADLLGNPVRDPHRVLFAVLREMGRDHEYRIVQHFPGTSQEGRLPLGRGKIDGDQAQPMIRRPPRTFAHGRRAAAAGEELQNLIVGKGDRIALRFAGPRLAAQGGQRLVRTY